MSARRGWLPKGFTELEYLESSGTQYINTNIIPSEECSISAYSAKTGNVFSFVCGANTYGTRDGQGVTTAGVILLNRITASNTKRARFGLSEQNGLGFDDNDMHKWELNQKKVFIDSILFADFSDVVFDATSRAPVALFGQANVHENESNNYIGYNLGSARIGEFKLQEAALKLSFVPVLDADGTPCMYDKISRTCFYNNGSGTFGYRVKTTGTESAPFSLRDPYYTPPSGVYARPSGENQLEILADSEETTGDGWEWFANTGEANEHFGIKQEELLTNELTNE